MVNCFQQIVLIFVIIIASLNMLVYSQTDAPTSSPPNAASITCTSRFGPAVPSQADNASLSSVACSSGFLVSCGVRGKGRAVGGTDADGSTCYAWQGPHENTNITNITAVARCCSFPGGVIAGLTVDYFVTTYDWTNFAFKDKYPDDSTWAMTGCHGYLDSLFAVWSYFRDYQTASTNATEYFKNKNGVFGGGFCGPQTQSEPSSTWIPTRNGCHANHMVDTENGGAVPWPLMSSPRMFQVHAAYNWQCETKAESGIQSATFSGCRAGFTLMGCNAYADDATTTPVSSYYITAAGECVGELSASATLSVSAICCKIIDAPTSAPTRSPTPSPTASPTEPPTESPSTATAPPTTKEPTARLATFEPTTSTLTIYSTESVHNYAVIIRTGSLNATEILVAVASAFNLTSTTFAVTAVSSKDDDDGFATVELLVAVSDTSLDYDVIEATLKEAMVKEYGDDIDVDITVQDDEDDTPPSERGSLWPWLVPVASVCVCCCGAAAVVYWWRRRKHSSVVQQIVQQQPPQQQQPHEQQEPGQEPAQDLPQPGAQVVDAVEEIEMPAVVPGASEEEEKEEQKNDSDDQDGAEGVRQSVVVEDAANKHSGSEQLYGAEENKNNQTTSQATAAGTAGATAGIDPDLGAYESKWMVDL